MKNIVTVIILIFIGMFLFREIVAVIIGLIMSLAWLPLGFAILAKYILWILVFLILYKVVKYIYKD